MSRHGRPSVVRRSLQDVQCLVDHVGIDIAIDTSIARKGALVTSPTVDDEVPVGAGNVKRGR